MLDTLQHPRVWQLLGWLLVACAVILSLIPGSVVPHTPGGDKLAHAVTYVVLTLWFAGLYPRSRYLWIALLLFTLGVVIEWAQGAIAVDRTRDYHDVIANSAGISFGLALALLWLGNWVQRVEGLAHRS